MLGAPSRNSASGDLSHASRLAHRLERGLAGGQQAGDRHRLAHRLGVLELVAQHHLADHAVAEPARAQRLDCARR